MPLSIARRGAARLVLSTKAWRGAARLAIVTAVVAMAAGCSDTSGSGSDARSAAATSSAVATVQAPPADATTVPPTGDAPATTFAAAGSAGSGDAASASASTSGSIATIDPNATLQQALAALTVDYHFTSTASVNGAVALVADGDRIGDGSRFTVTANGATVAYVITADGTWVRQSGGAWQQIDDPPATADPIAALRSPSGVTVASSDGATTQLAVTVAGTSLGLEGDSAVTVQATIVHGVLGAAAYATKLGTAAAVVTSTFGPAADATPVVAPAP